jgi:hypothetical protein
VRHVAGEVKYRPRVDGAGIDAQLGACRLEPSLDRGHLRASASTWLAGATAGAALSDHVPPA